MNNSRIFITGANGQLGQALAAKYPEATAVGRTEFDIIDPASYEMVDWDQFDTIINAAAMTDVDGAETAEGRLLAWAVNAAAVGLMAKIATAHNLTLVHISSDYVFDGTQESHTENEPYSPLSAYGQSKAAGDIAASVTRKHYILRTSWAIGKGKNFLAVMQDIARRDIKPAVVNDQTGRLTFVTTLVDAIDHLLTSASAHGIYNCSNEGDSVSWADIAKIVFKKSGKSGDDVTPVTTETYYDGKDGIAPRPLQSTLDLEKLKATGFMPSDWRTELNIYLNDMEEKS